MKSTKHKTTVILADMGKLRAFRLYPPGTELSPHAGPETIEEIELPKMEWDTDRSGRFPQGDSVPAVGGLSPGENHNEESEYVRRRIELLAAKISDLLKQEGSKVWIFAAPASINNRILSLLPSTLQNSLISNITADFTHLKLADIEDRFLSPSRKR